MAAFKASTVPHNFVDHVGKTFGMLEVLGRAPGKPRQTARWFCRCKCGNVRDFAASHLVAGVSTNCGCMSRRKAALDQTRHGRSRSSIHRIWLKMKQRCHSPNGSSYRNYGARGIRVCDLWRWSFEDFLKDMGERPKGMSIDRIDNDGDYCPMNCRWATPKEQSRNTRRNVLLTFDGRTMTVVAWSEATGIKAATIEMRLAQGWTTEDALTRPVQYQRPSELMDRTKPGKARGERNARSKLTLAKIQEIRQKRASGRHWDSLAEEYGLHESTIIRALSGKSWRHAQPSVTATIQDGTTMFPPES